MSTTITEISLLYAFRLYLGKTMLYVFHRGKWREIWNIQRSESLFLYYATFNDGVYVISGFDTILSIQENS